MTTAIKKRYDYIIVGAGTSGSIVAAELSNNPDISVLLIEAGGAAEDFDYIWNPNNKNCLADMSDIHWQDYNYEPQPFMNGRVFDCRRARMTGGCASHNDMVYVRGAPYDFDEWERVYGCNGWKYDDVKANFENIEKRLGVGPTVKNEFADDFINACNHLGFPSNSDWNTGGTMRGVGAESFTIDADGNRNTSYKTYAAPLIGQRENLDVSLHTLVDRVLFSPSKKAVAVSCIIRNKRETIEASEEIILSGGAINSPQILLRSGIGNGAELKTLGVDVVHDLPGVGENLREGMIFNGIWRTNKSITNQPSNLGYAIVWDQLNAHGQPRVCAQMSRGTYTCAQGRAELENHYIVTGGMMRLQSTGSVKLRTSDPQAAPIITLNFLSHENDFNDCLLGFNLMREIGNSPGLSAWRKEETVPGPGVTSPSQIKNWILENGKRFSHPNGTCKMGPATDHAVVTDSQLKVYGVDGLRVVDVSVMPAKTSGHPQGPAFMIGDKGAELILNCSKRRF